MKKYTFLVLALLAYSQINAQYSKKTQLKYIEELSSDNMKGRGFGTEESRLSAELIAKTFKKNNLKPCVGDSFLIEFEHNGKKGQNVCGIKQGKSKDIYAFGAHYDHIGYDDKGDDKIFNGADDNASGTSTVMALSDYFKDKKTEKTLMYMAFDAEEIGLVGSKKLVENEAFSSYLSDMKVMLNLEMLGTLSAFGEGKVYMTGSDRSDLMALMNSNTKTTFKVESDPYLKQQLFFRSDNVNFVNKGVVSHSLSTVNMENQHHYHQKNDELDVIKIDNLSIIAQGIGYSIEEMMKQNQQPKYSK
ncbi:Peptidase family M28 [Chishuiella changwenlii]|uniref:Peptidase M28 n=1 Tax=Chishuiella changwenlii TaxID=1434701 RepID=A0A1M6TME5_9FLAO|nr:M28 family peptidase [Chishuiella changwenlii]GGF03646.1 peptidase M28 [Chishuiella changwenlii]SHK58090.1 Peptidase family M28 [Chishuiella changwenlii]